MVALHRSHTWRCPPPPSNPFTAGPFQTTLPRYSFPHHTRGRFLVVRLRNSTFFTRRLIKGKVPAENYLTLRATQITKVGVTWWSKITVIASHALMPLLWDPSQRHSAWALLFGCNLWVPCFDLYALIQRRSRFTRWAPPAFETPHLILFMFAMILLGSHLLRLTHSLCLYCRRYGSEQRLWPRIYLHYSRWRRRSISGSFAESYSCCSPKSSHSYCCYAACFFTGGCCSHQI